MWRQNRALRQLADGTDQQGRDAGVDRLEDDGQQVLRCVLAQFAVMGAMVERKLEPPVRKEVDESRLLPRFRRQRAHYDREPHLSHSLDAVA